MTRRGDLLWEVKHQATRLASSATHALEVAESMSTDPTAEEVAHLAELLVRTSDALRVLVAVTPARSDQ